MHVILVRESAGCKYSLFESSQRHSHPGRVQPGELDEVFGFTVVDGGNISGMRRLPDRPLLIAKLTPGTRVSLALQVLIGSGRLKT